MIEFSKLHYCDNIIFMFSDAKELYTFDRLHVMCIDINVECKLERNLSIFPVILSNWYNSVIPNVS